MNVSAEHLSMHFIDGERKIDIFQDLNFAVPSGKSLAIVGRSGVGKSTLLYLLGTLELPTGGNICLGDAWISELRRSSKELSTFRGKNIGFIFQSHLLLPEFDALENVAFPLLIQGTSVKQAQERAAQLLTRVGLAERLTHRPGMLSGGEQQRVSIARALAAKPGLVLADEPTGNLDMKTGGTVIELLKQLQAEEGTTLIVVTHSLEIAAQLDQVLELTPKGLLPREIAPGAA